MSLDSFEQDFLRNAPIRRIRYRQADLFPDERKLARVVIYGFIEYASIADRHEPPGILSAFDPHRRVRRLNWRRLAHLHDRGLYEVESHYIAAHAAHHNPIAD